jgi:hypothetical protein
VASTARALVTPKPAFARAMVIDVGGVGGLLDGFSDFPLGYVYPDLYIKEIDRPTLSLASVLRGGTVDLSAWKVSNAALRAPQPPRAPIAKRAPGDAPGDVAPVVDGEVTTVSVGYYLSTSSSGGEGDRLLGSASVSRSTLIAGASADVTGTTLTVPADWPAGAAYILAIVDNDNRVPEIRPPTGNGETNNVVALPITVTASAGMDLVTIDPSSTTLVIGGANVSYVATISNGTGATQSDVLVQADIIQGSASRAAGFTVTSCAALGVVPTGTCTFSFSYLASNSTAGSGMLVPGNATARFQLRQGDGLLDTFTFPVTLTN